MTDQFAKSFAKAGGIGLAPQVYKALLKEQGLSAS
jgi:Rod binding domain-containing protein